MKKGYLLLVVLLCAIFVTACGSNGYKNRNTRTVEDLLDEYVDAYLKPDVELAKDMFPKFYVEYAKDLMTQERLEQGLERSKEIYGDDFHITYEVTKTTKYTEDELAELNKKMEDRYYSKVDASECYKVEGTITFVGSKDEDPDPLDTMAYCKYEGEWFLVGI